MVSVMGFLYYCYRPHYDSGISTYCGAKSAVFLIGSMCFALIQVFEMASNSTSMPAFLQHSVLELLFLLPYSISGPSEGLEIWFGSGGKILLLFLPKPGREGGGLILPPIPLPCSDGPACSLLLNSML